MARSRGPTRRQLHLLSRTQSDPQYRTRRFISRLKGAGNIHAEGLTVPELEIAIGRSYAGVLRDPEISVALKRV